MRFLILLKSGSGDDMSPYNEQLARAGVLLAAETLHPSAGKDLAGFWIIEVRSREEALEWMKRAPDDLEVELREVV
jgi:hypothetical protein